MGSTLLSLKERFLPRCQHNAYLAALTRCHLPSPKPGGKVPEVAWTDGLPLSGQELAGGCSGALGLPHDFGRVPEPAPNMGHQ